MADDKAFEEKKTVLHRKTQPKHTNDKDQSKYAAPKRVKASTAGEKLEEVRDEYAKNADKPTTASAQVGSKDLPSIIQQVDPSGQAQVIPQLYQKMQQMFSLLSMGSGLGMGSGGGGGNDAGSMSGLPSGIQTTINDSFTGALAMLVKKYGFEPVVMIFNNVLSNGGLDEINSLYRDIVTNSLANLIRLALYFGPTNIPVSQYDDTIFGDLIPDKVVTLDEVPDLYIKQYYNLDDDPYPGYQEWMSQDGKKTKVYTRKEPGSYHCTTMNEEVYSTSEKELFNALDVYFIYLKNGPYAILTPALLNDILYNQMVSIENNIMNSGMGNNSTQNNNMGSMMGGALMQMMSMIQSLQLPNSMIEGSEVLPQSDINQSLQSFQKNMGLNNQIFEIGKSVLAGGGAGSPLSALGNMGGIGNIMGGFGIGGGGLSGIMGGSLMGGFGSFGGGSGGGGGGAGSGFGSASGGGSYQGGGVSKEGLQNISALLTKLGIEQ